MENSAVLKLSIKQDKTLKMEKRESDGEKIRDAALGKLKRSQQDIEIEIGGVTPEKKKYQHDRSNELSRAIDEITRVVAESNELKRREVDIADRKLVLEEARFETEKTEREARFALEKQERQAQIQLMMQLMGEIKKKNRNSLARNTNLRITCIFL